MSKLTKTTKPPSLEDRYRLFNRLIDGALFKYHPDHYRGEKPHVAEAMTRKLIAEKSAARRLFEKLTGRQP